MPDNLYFRQPETQTMLWDVLFTWAKLNPDVSYRQGMHELAAPILWAIERDAIDPETIPKNEPTSQAADINVIRSVFEHESIEHDTFTLFNLIMEKTKSSYAHTADVQRSKLSTEAAAPTHVESPMVHRCRHILEFYVAQTDPQLASHMEEIQVIPQVFLL